MLHQGLEFLEKSLEHFRPHTPPSPIHASRLELALFRIAKWGLVGTATTLYLLCHDAPFLWACFMAFLFAYSFAGLAHLLVDFIVYIFTDPVCLPEREDVAKQGIPASTRAVFVRPIFAKTTDEMKTLLDNMKRDIEANQEPHRQMKFIVIDNTRAEDVRAYVRTRIRALQGEFGEDVVFYFHRNPECDFFKKLGIYQDLVMLLLEGWTRPRHYTDPKWAPSVRGTRDPSKPVWDEILGDVNTLGIHGSAADILAGREVTVPKDDRVEIAFVADADNVWPAGQPRKIVAKILHPANRLVSIFQPGIELSNPDDNGFIRMNAWAREMYGFDPVAKWRLYRFSPFYGKGAMNLPRYAEDIIKAEALDPGRAASHDFQESLHTPTVLVEDSFILEKTFSNKLSELTRGAQWLWGDMETVRQFLLRHFDAGRKEHLWMLARIAVGPLVYATWLAGTVISFLADWVASPAFLWILFLAIAGVNLAVPKVLLPYLHRHRKRGYDLEKDPLLLGTPFHTRSWSALLALASWETLASTLIHSLDLIYRPRAFVRNLVKQLTGREFVWITGAMGEMESASMSLGDMYKTLASSTAVGAVLLVLIAAGTFRGSVALFLAPCVASFLLGPLAIWLTAKPTARKATP
jgi:hypothetical protein